MQKNQKQKKQTTKIMQVKKVYQADDGTSFNNEHDCVLHEYALEIAGELQTELRRPGSVREGFASFTEHTAPKIIALTMARNPKLYREILFKISEKQRRKGHK